MDADVGTRIPLPARSVRDAVCEAMGSAVPEGFRPQRATPTTVAAGTDEPERVAVDGVAADTAVFDTEAATSYRDDVKHSEEVCMCCPSWVVNVLCSVHGYESARREHRRRARLSRWQEQR